MSLEVLRLGLMSCATSAAPFFKCACWTCLYLLLLSYWTRLGLLKYKEKYFQASISWCEICRHRPEQTHWDFLILIAGLILALFLYNKKVVIYKTEFKQAKNNRIQWKKFQKISKFKKFYYIIFFFTCLTYN
jgi:hypothetical protein